MKEVIKGRECLKVMFGVMGLVRCMEYGAAMLRAVDVCGLDGTLVWLKRSFKGVK